MANKSVLLTEAGLKKLQDKLDHLKSVRRIEVADRLKAAIALGDLSENSEYDDAKNEQAFLEGEIAELEESIRHAKIIEVNGDADVVAMGSKIVLKDLEFNETESYQLVGSTEADPDEGKISNESPVGSAIIGKSVGDVVEVHVGENVINYEIVEITH
ncbi:MAG: transcription elongation factor GreA [Anaerovibrio sp.]|uniref:transcription elongation factor GreA n=1 Tax=Anaerovibrio sp. TaxID=1872532 RepID=UPI0025FA3489|nr:transcription elongation factor GreA [Anaerovibrio sp.]MCR5175452.1 transcription elongation factor GreA [Anaerovibrio sp.]